MRLKIAFGVAMLGLACAAQAACPSTPGRFVTDGAEVADSQTGLIWARCSVGQSWNGIGCTGTASTFTHELALQMAQATIGWRLPNVKELSSIVDKGCQNPAIDQTVFPNMYALASYWTSTPYAGSGNAAWPYGVGGNAAWSVSFGLGYVSDAFREPYTYHPARLVRASP